jgi:hypothetical protein
MTQIARYAAAVAVTSLVALAMLLSSGLAGTSLG